MSDVVCPKVGYALVERADDKTESGIVLAQASAAKMATRGDAVRCRVIDGDFTVGDLVYVVPGAGYAVKHEGHDALLVENEAIIGFVDRT